MSLPWCPTFVIDEEEFVFTLPVTRWVPGGRTIGSTAKDGYGNPGNEIQLRRYLLGMTLRFEDPEWPMVKSFIQTAQMGRDITWLPNPEEDIFGMPDEFIVKLETPRVTDMIRPTRDSRIASLLSLPIVVSSSAVLNVSYFPLD